MRHSRARTQIAGVPLERNNPPRCCRPSRGRGRQMGPAWPQPPPSKKDEKTYKKLRDQGESEEKSARIANAAAGSSRSKVGGKVGKSGSYDDWSKQDLVQRAKEIGIKGRSKMTKAELVKALRDHW